MGELSMKNERETWYTLHSHILAQLLRSHTYGYQQALCITCHPDCNSADQNDKVADTGSTMWYSSFIYPLPRPFTRMILSQYGVRDSPKGCVIYIASSRQSRLEHWL